MNAAWHRFWAATTGEGTPAERRESRRWAGPGDPERILVIRTQAIGDALLALPIGAGLRERYPRARLGMLIGDRARAVADTSDRFDHVEVIDLQGGRRARVRSAIRTGMRLRGQWDVVLDLQRNRESRIVRRIIAPQAFGELDRYGSRHAAERFMTGVTEAGLACTPVYSPHVRAERIAAARARMRAESPGARRFVLLNPGGAFVTRNWPIERWVSLAQRFASDTAVVIFGDPRMAAAADALRAGRGYRLVDLYGRTTLTEALELVAACDLVISEDGGLLHAAWTAGRPSVALLGGTRSDWCHPLGPHSRWRGSQDLPCGDCMQPTCARGDVLCMTRITVDEVLAMAFEALGSRP